MRAWTGPALSRRGLLLAAGAAPLAACTSDPEPPPPPDPDDVLREEAVARERALLREYDAVLLVLPALAVRLAPVRAEHAQHLLALTGAPEPSASPGATTAPVPAVPPPATAAAALAGLVRAERAAAAEHAAAVLGAARGLAGLLASLSASEASHPVVLS